MEPVDAALALAATGVPVFPCLSSKAPACAGGFKSATLDPGIVRALFANPAAELVGVPTGAVSGIDVLDLDPRNGSDEWWQAHASRLPATVIHETRSGGKHLLFRHSEGLRSSVERLAPGCDVRSTGGYVIWWPASGLTAAGSVSPAPWPSWILSGLQRSPESTAERTASGNPPPSAADVVDLLLGLPNPLSARRDTYTRVMLAAAGCARALGGDSCGMIEDAAVAWAEKWEGGAGADERAKWRDDWSQRANVKAGWNTLLAIAYGLDPAFCDPSAGREFDALPAATIRTGLLGRFVFPADCAKSAPRGYLVKHLLAPSDVAA